MRTVCLVCTIITNIITILEKRCGNAVSKIRGENQNEELAVTLKQNTHILKSKGVNNGDRKFNIWKFKR
mgnify:FL=1